MGRSVEEIRNDITNGGTSLGIEFGSTRIKAVLVDSTTAPVAQGSYAVSYTHLTLPTKA